MRNEPITILSLAQTLILAVWELRLKLLMAGNQVGALLMDFVLDNADLTSLVHPAVVKTVVTSELGAEIARKKGLTVFSTLTGFKFIGEKIT